MNLSNLECMRLYSDDMWCAILTAYEKGIDNLSAPLIQPQPTMAYWCHLRSSFPEECTLLSQPSLDVELL